MKTFVEFFIVGIVTGELIEACGYRSVIRLDGRMNRLDMEAMAEEECRKRNYVAWRLIKGPSLLRAKPITKTVPLYY